MLPASVTAATPINLEHLRHFTDGNREEEKMLFDLFLEQAEKAMTTLTACLPDAEADRWRAAAHLLKGASGNLGAEQLQHRCQRAESNPNAPIEEKQRTLDAIRAALLKVRVFIQQLEEEDNAHRLVCG